MKLRIKPKELKVLFLVYLAPFLLIGLMWNWLPEKIPMHIDAETASITSYYSPFNHILFIGGINLILMLVLALDKRSLTFKVIGMVIFSLIALLPPLIALFDASREQFMRAIFLFLSSVIITLGILMRTEKPERNIVFGIRIPYTFKSEENWRMAHEWGSKVMIAGGIVLLLVSLLAPFSQLTTIYIIVAFLIIAVTFGGIAMHAYRAKNSG